jgi:hypothetical protein
LSQGWGSGSRFKNFENPDPKGKKKKIKRGKICPSLVKINFFKLESTGTGIGMINQYQY